MPGAPLFRKRQGASAEELGASVLAYPPSSSLEKRTEDNSPDPISSFLNTDFSGGALVSPGERSQRNRSGYSVRWTSPSVTAHRADTPTAPSFTSSLPRSGQDVQVGGSSLHTTPQTQAQVSNGSGRSSKEATISPRYQNNGIPELTGPRIVSHPTSSLTLPSPLHPPAMRRIASPSPGLDVLPCSRPGSSSIRSQLNSRSGVVGMRFNSSGVVQATTEEGLPLSSRQHVQQQVSSRREPSSSLLLLLRSSTSQQMMQFQGMGGSGGGSPFLLTANSKDGVNNNSSNNNGGSGTSLCSSRSNPRRVAVRHAPTGDAFYGPLGTRSAGSGGTEWNTGEKSSDWTHSFFSSLPSTASGSLHETAGSDRLGGRSSCSSSVQARLSGNSANRRMEHSNHSKQTKHAICVHDGGNSSSHGVQTFGLRKEMIEQLDTFMLTHCARHIPEPQRTGNYRKVLGDLSTAAPGIAPLLLNVSRHLKELIDTLQQVQQSHQETLSQQEKNLFQKFVDFFEEKILEILREKKVAEMNVKRLEEEGLELRRSRDEELMSFKKEMMIKLNNCEKREDQFQSFRTLIASVFQTNQRLISRTEELEEILRKHRIEFPPLPGDIIDVRTSAAADEGRQALLLKDTGEEEKEAKAGELLSDKDRQVSNHSLSSTSATLFSSSSRERSDTGMAVVYPTDTTTKGSPSLQARGGLSHHQQLAVSHPQGLGPASGNPYFRSIHSQVPISFIKASAEEMSAARLTLQKELLNCAFDERTAYRLEVNKLKSDNAELKLYISKLEETVTDLHRYIHEKRFLSTDENGDAPLTPRPKEIPFSIQAELGIDLRKHTGEIMSEMGAVSISLKHQLNSALLRLRQMITVTEWMQEDTLVGIDEEMNGKGGVLPTVPVSAWSSVPHFLRTHVYPDVPNLKWSETETGAILYEFFQHYKELRESCWGYRDRRMLRPRILQLFERRLSPLVVLDVMPEEMLHGGRRKGGKEEETILPFGYIVSQFIRHYLMNLAISNPNRQQTGAGKAPLNGRDGTLATPGDGAERSEAMLQSANASPGATEKRENNDGAGVDHPAEPSGSAFNSPSSGGLALPGTLHPTYYTGNTEHVVELEFTRLAYNLWWAANRYSSTQPLCYLFVAVVHGKLPIQIFDVMQQCLSVVTSCVKQIDADGSGTFTYPKLMNGVQRIVDDLGVDVGRSAILACVQTFEENHSPLFGGRVSTAALLADESSIMPAGGGGDSHRSPTTTAGTESHPSGGGSSANGVSSPSSTSKGTLQSGGGKGAGQIRQIHTGSLLPPRITATRLPFKSEQPPGASVFLRFWRRLVIRQYESVYSTLEQLLSPLVVESEVVFGLYVLPIPEALHRIQQYDKVPPEWETNVREIFFPSASRGSPVWSTQEGSHSHYSDDGESNDAEWRAKKVMSPLSSPATPQSRIPRSDPLNSDALPEGGSDAFLSLIREQGEALQERWTGQRERMEQAFQLVIHALPRLNRSVHFPFTAAALKSNAVDGHAVGSMLNKGGRKRETSATFEPVAGSDNKGEGANPNGPDSPTLLFRSSPSSGDFTDHTNVTCAPNEVSSATAAVKGSHGTKNIRSRASPGTTTSFASLMVGEENMGIKAKKKQKQRRTKWSRRSSFSSMVTSGLALNNEANKELNKNTTPYAGSGDTHKGRKGFRTTDDRRAAVSDGDPERIVVQKDRELVEWHSFCHALRQRSVPLAGKLFKWGADPENSSWKTAQWFNPSADEEKHEDEEGNKELQGEEE